MSNLGENIRRIARYDKLKERIRRAEEQIRQNNKEPINGKRGASYASANGFISSGAGGVGTSTPNNGGNTNGTTDQSGATDGTTQGSTFDGGDLKTDASRPKESELVQTINLKDCDSGQLIDVNLFSGDATGENIFQPPDGFGTTNSTPTSGTVYAGYYWTSGSPSQYSADSQSALDISEAQANALLSPGDSAVSFQRWALVSDSSQDPGAPSPTDLRARFTRWSYTPSGGGSSFVQVSGPNLFLCAGPYGDGRDTACSNSNDENYVPAALTEWPEGTTSQLSWNSQKGGFFSSKYDTAIPLKYDRDQETYDTGLSKMNLCTLDDDPVTIQALDGGGFVFYSTGVGGAPDANEDILKFDKDGRYQGLISNDQYGALT